ncbi:MAG: amidophosphoribosyltransferase [Candidatus Bathyarchaeia archaeon]
MSLRESCGVFGAYSSDGDVFPYLYWGMVAQNHRGHQSYGFATLNGGAITRYSDLGLIPTMREVDQDEISHLTGNSGVANVRYATSGPGGRDALRRDAMPIHIKGDEQSLALSFNGNIVNVRDLQSRVGVSTDKSDAYALTKLILEVYSDTGSISEAALECMEEVEGSYSVTGVTNDGLLFAFKDPLGIKPLCYGGRGEVRAFSSESVGLDINGLALIREVEPGELMTIKGDFVDRQQIIESRRRAFCSFEFAYFARPDAKLNGKYIYQARKDFGKALARFYSDVAERCEVVIGLPETANDATYGFHEESGLPWDMSTRRHRYVTQRAFITETGGRDRVIFRKVNILGELVKGKRIALIDDSIVRGDTTKSTIKRLREAGASEIHLFITFPKIIGPCFYGINMATFEELIGARLTTEEIAEEINADSVNYLPIDEYISATGMSKFDLCTGCVTHQYPTPMAQSIAKEGLARLREGVKEEGRIYE